MPLVERCCLHEVRPVSTILRSPPRGVQTADQLTGFRSFSTVRVHVCLGRPRGRFQSAGGPFQVQTLQACNVAEELLQSSATDDVKLSIIVSRPIAAGSALCASSTISYFTVHTYKPWLI